MRTITCKCSFAWSTDCSINRLIDWLIGWSIDWLIDLIDWLVGWSVDWSVDWLIDWLHHILVEFPLLCILFFSLHFRADLFCNEEIPELLEYKPWWETVLKTPGKESLLSFSEEELDVLKELPRQQFQVSPDALPYTWSTLAELIFGYAYDHRTTLGSPTVRYCRCFLNGIFCHMRNDRISIDWLIGWLMDWSIDFPSILLVVVLCVLYRWNRHGPWPSCLLHSHALTVSPASKRPSARPFAVVSSSLCIVTSNSHPSCSKTSRKSSPWAVRHSSNVSWPFAGSALAPRRTATSSTTSTWPATASGFRRSRRRTSNPWPGRWRILRWRNRTWAWIWWTRKRRQSWPCESRPMSPSR